MKKGLRKPRMNIFEAMSEDARGIKSEKNNNSPYIQEGLTPTHLELDCEQQEQNKYINT